MPKTGLEFANEKFESAPFNEGLLYLIVTNVTSLEIQ
jgi:hypothetical protein